VHQKSVNSTAVKIIETQEGVFIPLLQTFHELSVGIMRGLRVFGLTIP